MEAPPRTPAPNPGPDEVHRLVPDLRASGEHTQADADINSSDDERSDEKEAAEAELEALIPVPNAEIADDADDDWVVLEDMARDRLWCILPRGIPSYPTVLRFDSRASDVLLLIFSMLLPVDLCRLARVDKRTHLLSEADALWSVLAQRYLTNALYTYLRASSGRYPRAALTTPDGL